MSIPTTENNLDKLKSSYFNSLQEVVNILSKKQDEFDPLNLLNTFHKKGTEYFNTFERTLDEYSLPNFEITEDIKNRKSEDTLNMVDTIINHWNTISLFCSKYELLKPQPSITAYATIQRVIKKFNPELIQTIKDKFSTSNLPIHGFLDKKKHSGWKRNKFSIQLFIGIPLLTISGLLIFLWNDPTGIQYLFMRVILALSISILGVATLEGTVKLNWSVKRTFAVTATGWIAVFILLYYFNPPLAPK